MDLQEIRWGLGWPSDSEGGSEVDETADDEYEDEGMDPERYLDGGADNDENDDNELDSPSGSAK